MFAAYPLRCSLGSLGFALRDSAAARPRQGAARTRGGTLAGGASRTRGASGSERSRAAMSAPASLPIEITRSAGRGELPKVVKWLRKGGAVDAHCSATTRDGSATTITLLRTAAANGHLAIVKELLNKRGASVDLQDSFGGTALMEAAYYGHLSILLVLLQHSANADLQDIDGRTALMWATFIGHEPCVQALLRAKANPDLQDVNGITALMWAAGKKHEACNPCCEPRPTPSCSTTMAAPP